MQICKQGFTCVRSLRWAGHGQIVPLFMPWRRAGPPSFGVMRAPSQQRSALSQRFLLNGLLGAQSPQG